MHNIIKEAIEVLKKGGIILYPTDTIWGIGCDATNPEAVDRVYKLKQREDSKSMLVLVHNPNLINQYINDVPDVAWDLIEVTDKPLTIIYPDAKNLASNLIAANGSVGIRVVKHAFCEQLIHRFRKPIVSTSANISGSPSPKGFYDIDDRILDGVDYIVPTEFDESTSTSPSGIIQLGKGGEVKVIRE
ncbi:MAG: L-threonylcarbamoyladenylate synthase [Bacteroidales bacterium]